MAKPKAFYPLLLESNYMDSNWLDGVLVQLMGVQEGNRIFGWRDPVTPRELSSSLRPESLSDIQNFRLVNKRFNDIYTLRFGATPPILRLPSNVLDRILVQLINVSRDDPIPSKDHPSLNQLSASLQPRDLRNILHFRLVNKRFSEIYTMRFHPPPPIMKLPAEILDIVLELLVHNSGSLMPVDKKASLSVESFAVQLPSQEDSNQTGNFRLTCKRFAELGLKCQFARVSILFSKDGFKRLEWVSGQPHIAKVVKQFTYKVPLFYPQGRRLFELFEEILNQASSRSRDLEEQIRNREQINGSHQSDRLRPTINSLRVSLRRSRIEEEQIVKTMAKAEHQRQILDGRMDLNGLVYGFRAFRKSLQQIRFLKVVDQIDAGWARYLDTHPALAAEFRPLEWTVACEHAARTLTLAFLQSNAEKVNRLSSRFIDPQIPLELTPGSQATILRVASRLNSLELEFDNRPNIHENVLELSQLFQAVFNGAVNLQSLHVGFRRAVSVPIEVVFHNVRWEKLSYVGLHMWKLESSELIRLLRRHRESLKHLRLRYIEIKDGTWDEILRMIRLELSLKWISLRGICYSSTQAMGAMHFGHQGDNDPDSDPDDDHWSESEYEETYEGDEEEEREEVSEHYDDETEESDDESDDNADNDDHDSDVGQTEQDVTESATLHPSISEPERLNDKPRRRASSTIPRCDCDNGNGWLDLDDNGIRVEKEQWKRWQEWVIKRCPTHDVPAATAQSKDLSPNDGSQDGR